MMMRNAKTWRCLKRSITKPRSAMETASLRVRTRKHPVNEQFCAVNEVAAGVEVDELSVFPRCLGGSPEIW